MNSANSIKYDAKLKILTFRRHNGQQFPTPDLQRDSVQNPLAVLAFAGVERDIAELKLCIT